MQTNAMWSWGQGTTDSHKRRFEDKCGNLNVEHVLEKSIVSMVNFLSVKYVVSQIISTEFI